MDHKRSTHPQALSLCCLCFSSYAFHTLCVFSQRKRLPNRYQHLLCTISTATSISPHLNALKCDWTHDEYSVSINFSSLFNVQLSFKCKKVIFFDILSMDCFCAEKISEWNLQFNVDPRYPYKHNKNGSQQ